MPALPAAPDDAYVPLTDPAVPLAAEPASGPSAPGGGLTDQALEWFRTGPLPSYRDRAEEVETAVLAGVTDDAREALVAPVRGAVFAGFALGAFEAASGARRDAAVHPAVAAELGRYGADVADPLARRAARAAAQAAYVAVRDPGRSASDIVAGLDLTARAEADTLADTTAGTAAAADTPAVLAAPVAPVAPSGWARLRHNRIARGVAAALVAIVVSLGFGAFRAHEASASAPKVGECAKRKGENGIAKVDCAASDAEFTVVKHVDDSDDGEAACADTQATSYYVETTTSRGDTMGSFVLCLTDR